MKLLFKNSLIALIFSVILSSCNSGPTTVGSDPNSHKVKVKEVLQVSGYTYLRATENGEEVWLAVPSMEAKAGDVFYYAQGMLMTDFASRELDRTFKSIMFVEQISTDPIATPSGTKDPHGMGGMQAPGTGGSMTKPVIGKEDVQIDPLEGGTSIAQLFEAKESFAGKTVTVRGKVTKVNNEIMGKNWIHIQDGTEFDGKFDLTVTTSGSFEPGTIVTLEGMISVMKDFGAGYSYEVIMEDATAK